MSARRSAGRGALVLALVAAAGLCAAAPAQASAQLAMDKGCYNCHGGAARDNVPSFAQLAQRYAPYRGDVARHKRVVEALLEHHAIGGIRAHERLSEDSATQLVRWLFDGAPP